LHCSVDLVYLVFIDALLQLKALREQLGQIRLLLPLNARFRDYELEPAKLPMLELLFKFRQLRPMVLVSLRHLELILIELLLR
jgi:hypothetical protein